MRKMYRKNKRQLLKPKFDRTRFSLLHNWSLGFLFSSFEGLIFSIAAFFRPLEKTSIFFFREKAKMGKWRDIQRPGNCFRGKINSTAMVEFSPQKVIRVTFLQKLSNTGPIFVTDQHTVICRNKTLSERSLVPSEDTFRFCVAFEAHFSLFYFWNIFPWSYIVRL